MEKLTAILAVALDEEEATLVLDKAVTVARCFGAQVEVLVNDSGTAQRVTAHCALREYTNVILHSVAHSQEASYQTILRRVAASRPDLVVKVAASDKSLRRVTSADNDWDLANECPVPVLLVRRQAWSQPVKFAAAVDVSDQDNATLARSILHTAGFLALGTHGNLDILYSEREAKDEMVRMDRAVRLAQLVREFHAGYGRLQIFSGQPEQRLPPLVAARRYDVLVLGGESRRTGVASMFPGTASRMMEVTDSDVVLVRAPSLRAAFAAGAASGRQQRTNQHQELA